MYIMINSNVFGADKAPKPVNESIQFDENYYSDAREVTLKFQREWNPFSLKSVLFTSNMKIKPEL